MKKLIFIAAFIVLTVSLFSQKVPVSVIRNHSSTGSGWQILDENYSIVFQGSEYFRSDTVVFSLEVNKRYYFYCSVTIQPGEPVYLYTLVLDSEPLLLISSDMGAGDHFIPFFTGIRSFEAKITGGANALISEFPWQVFMISSADVCGGSIISEEWIITAAHCVTTESGSVVPPSEVFVVAGANNPYSGSEGETYEAIEIIRHERYDDESLENDIALIRLRDPIDIPQAQPVRIVTQEDVSFGATDPGVMAWVTGWGMTSQNPNVYPTRLQKVQLPIITNQQASTVWRSINSTVLMAGFRNGNKDACFGDSGGPLVVPVLGEYRLAGIVSWGSSACNTYGAYTRVSLFESWIRDHTGIQPLFKPPVPAGATLICKGQSTGSYTVGNVPGISGYEWRLSPSVAGSVTGTSTVAVISWNTSYTGPVSLAYRVITDEEYSDWSRLSINVAPLTEITNISPDTSIPFGSDYALSVQAGGHNLSYQWLKENMPVGNETGSTMLIEDANANDIGNYSVAVSGTCGVDRSDDVYLFVEGRPQAGGPEVLLWPSITSTSFNIAISGDAFYNLNIYNMKGQLVAAYKDLRYQNPIDVSALAGGTYLVTVFNSQFRKTLKIIRI